MKNYKKTITTLLTAAILLISAFMTGCTKLSEAPNSASSEVDTPGGQSRNATSVTSLQIRS